jgi:chloride channel protein, CIC family
MASRHDDRLADFTTSSRIVLLSAMAMVIGVMGSFVAYALVWLIGTVTNLIWYHRYSSALVSPAASTLGVVGVIVPIVGGLVIGLMARYGSDKIRGHGIPEALEAILIGQSRMSLKVAVLKPLSSAIAIGTGGPFGAEGPIIMTGGAFGSLFAQGFHLSASERKTLLVAGAAAGMAAIFATPIAAVLLAVELLLFEWKPRSFIPVALASIVAAACRTPLLGRGPLFPMAPHEWASWEILAVAAVVGIASGAASSIATWLVYMCEDGFAKLPLHQMWWPAIGGLAVGLGGLIEPRALGVGYDTIGALLTGHLVGVTVVPLLIVKALIWAIALGSGTSGGVLAPLLIMGGALGALESSWISVGDASLWAAVGMASMLGGTMRSPLTAAMFLLELTHDLSIVPAVFLACVVAHGFTVLVMRRSILTEKVARRGYHIAREYSVSPLVRFRVAEVMERDVPTIPASMPADALFRRLANDDPVLAAHHGWPIVDEAGALVGILTRRDLLAAVDREDADTLTVLQVGSAPPIVTFADNLLEEAVDVMLTRRVSRLPVVDRGHPERIIGMLEWKGLARAWQRATEEERIQESSSRFGARLRLARRNRRRARTLPDASSVVAPKR